MGGGEEIKMLQSVTTVKRTKYAERGEKSYTIMKEIVTIEIV